MTALFLAILSSASLALIFRTTEARGHSRYVITAMNYVAATVTAVVVYLVFPRPASAGNGGASAVAAADMFSASPSVIGLSVGTADLTPIVAIAVPGGVLFFVSFLLYQRAVADHGAGPAGMYGKLGILVPMVLSLIVWQEYPAPIQWAGLVTALIAIVVSQAGGRLRIRGAGRSPASRSTRRSPPASTAAAGASRSVIASKVTASSSPPAKSAAPPLKPLLLILLLSMGFAEFSNKLFERYGDDRYRALFLAILFGTALVSSVIVLVRRRERPRREEIGWGIAVGVPNLFSSFFLIASLRSVPATVAFPAFSAGSIGVIVLGARILYGDRLLRQQWAAVALTVVALVLINLA